MCINAQCCYYFICWQVPPASAMTIVKEVDPPTTRTTANTTLTRNLFSTDTSNLAAGLIHHRNQYGLPQKLALKRKSYRYEWLYVKSVCSF